MRTLAAAVLAAMLVATSAHATDEADALAAARKCAGEVNRRGVSAQVDCMDEAALAEFKNLMLLLFKRFPDDATAKRLFGDSASIDQIDALPPADLMRHFLQRREESAQQQKLTTSLAVIGAVKDGERVHVLVRERSGPLKPSGIEVATTEVHTYVKRNGQWRSELRGDVKKMEQMLRKQLGA